jgi:hypothetical protein
MHERVSDSSKSGLNYVRHCLGGTDLEEPSPLARLGSQPIQSNPGRPYAERC